jgi:hypothetical protein
MIVALGADGSFRLDEPDDFRKFKVVIAAGRDAFADLRGRFDGRVDFDDADTAWVAVAALRGRADDAAWQQGLSAMIEKAAPHGWVDAAGRRVRAHVEWQG